MALFSKILEKLGFGGTAEKPTTAPSSSQRKHVPDRFVGSQARRRRGCCRTTGAARIG